MICFDVPMPQEVFELLNKGIVNHTSYGVDVLQKPGSVTITFTNMRRLCALFNKFEDCEGFIKDLGTGKGVVKLIVDDRRNGIMRYKFKEEILQFPLWVLECIWHHTALNQEHCCFQLLI